MNGLKAASADNIQVAIGSFVTHYAQMFESICVGWVPSK